jgi:C-terminal processing protease CtpA/Prc
VNLRIRLGETDRWEPSWVRLPDRRELGFVTGGRWNLDPASPRIGGKVVFLTDGGAISYAESCLGIIEHYHLGEIVGQATAGTNGNVANIPLPGGYRISFTGMQVIKNDGGRHHGVGIRPTVEAYRTVRGIAAGRDEVLETGIEVAGRE